ncbi:MULTISPECIES: hypothetical protein [Listeria]|nr:MULTISPECIES: hypothetical protein [Listeria]
MAEKLPIVVLNDEVIKKGGLLIIEEIEQILDIGLSIQGENE